MEVIEVLLDERWQMRLYGTLMARALGGVQVSDHCAKEAVFGLSAASGWEEAVGAAAPSPW